MKKWRNRFSPRAIALVGVLFLMVGPVRATTYLDSVGYTELVQELTAKGIAVPDGSGVKVAQVEAYDSTGTNYIPDVANAEFAGVTFTNVTNTSSTASSHATTVAKYFYGDISGMAKGVNSVSLYAADSWMNTYLNYGVRTLPVSGSGYRVINCSWIGGSTTSSASDQQVLRRLDYSINVNHSVVVVGVNNGGTSSQYSLLNGAYNEISVGLTSGNHATGTTVIDTAGRHTVDIVAPSTLTSYATAMVSSAAALLVQTADTKGYTNASNNPEVIKAILMAGADKTAVASWTHDSTHPLDSVYGAGQLNVYNSYHIETAGEQNASTTAKVANTGWDYNTVSGNGKSDYYFDVAAGADSLTVILTWNRVVSGNDGRSLSWSLANLDLRIYDANGMAIGNQVALSASTIDNVECLYLTNLSGGTYAIEVTNNSASSASYAMAWQSVPEPATLAMLACGAMPLLRRRRK